LAVSFLPQLAAAKSAARDDNKERAVARKGPSLNRGSFQI
jgi:hypothetical protein